MVTFRSSLAAVRTPAFVFGLATSTALCATLALISVAHAASFPSIAADTAATARIDSTPARGMADTVTILKPIVIDADRSLTPGRASATTVRLDRASIARFQPSTTADALMSAPGVDISRTGPWASKVSLRGMSGERVLVLVDGVRLQSGRGHGAQTSLVSVDRLEGVELLPGAGGAQFGSDAMAGVVELTTHRNLLGERAATFMVTGHSGGPGNERSGLARVRWMSQYIGAEMSGGMGALDALVTPDGRVANSSYREDDYSARLQARIASSTLDFERTRHAAHDIQLPAFSTNAGSHAEYPLQSRGATRLEWTLPGTRIRPDFRLLGVTQHFRTGFVESVTDSQFLRGRYVASRTTNADDRISTWSSGIQPSLRRGSSRLYGEYRRETTQGPRTTDVTVVNAAGVQTSATTGVGESIPQARRDVLAGGGFTAGSWRKFRLEAGARYDWLRSQADSTPQSFTRTLDVTDRRWSLEGGLSRPIGALTPYTHVASGFRAPNLEERYYNDSIHGGMRLFGNPDLHAERSYTTELGVRTGEFAGGRIRGTRLSVYRSRVDELITLKYLGQLYLVPRFQYTNVHKAQIEGLELQVEAAVGPVRVAANAAFPRGRDLETGKSITDIGAARATLDVRIPLTRLVPLGVLAVRTRWTNASESDDAATETTLSRPAFWTASADLSTLLWNTRLTVTVKNLTNTRYREPMSFIAEPGRSVLLSMRRELALPL